MGSKVKLKLTQPQIMCHGRKPAECYYRAKVDHNGTRMMAFKFKAKGEEAIALYNKIDRKFYSPWQDLTFV